MLYFRSIKFPSNLGRRQAIRLKAADAAGETGVLLLVEADPEALMHKTDSGGVLLWPTG
jgi:hypothetical protein